jgi:hypothetical protein
MGMQRLLEDHERKIDQIINKCLGRLDNLKKGIEEEILLSRLEDKLVGSGRVKRRNWVALSEGLRVIPIDQSEM